MLQLPQLSFLTFQIKTTGEPAVAQTRGGFTIGGIERGGFVRPMPIRCVYACPIHHLHVQASVLMSMTLIAPPTEANIAFRVATPSTPPLIGRLQFTAADFLRYVSSPVLM